MFNEIQNALLLLLSVVVEVGIGAGAGLLVKPVVAVVGLPSQRRQAKKDLFAVFRILEPLHQIPLLKPPDQLGEGALLQARKFCQLCGVEL